MSNQFDLKKKMREAGERVKAQKELEEKQDKEAYENLLKSTQWKIFTGFMIFSAILGLLVGFDSVAPTHKDKIAHADIQFYSGQMKYDNGYYLPKTGQLGDFVETSFFVRRTMIFNEAKYLCWNREEWQADDDAPRKFVQECTVRRGSVFDWFPFLTIGLLIPVFVFFFKQPKPWFRFMRGMCMILIYPGSVFLFFYLIT